MEHPTVTVHIAQLIFPCPGNQAGRNPVVASIGRSDPVLAGDRLPILGFDALHRNLINFLLGQTGVAGVISAQPLPRRSVLGYRESDRLVVFRPVQIHRDARVLGIPLGVGVQDALRSGDQEAVLQVQVPLAAIGAQRQLACRASPFGPM